MKMLTAMRWQRCEDDITVCRVAARIAFCALPLSPTLPPRATSPPPPPPPPPQPLALNHLAELVATSQMTASLSSGEVVHETIVGSAQGTLAEKAHTQRLERARDETSAVAAPEECSAYTSIEPASALHQSQHYGVRTILAASTASRKTA